MNELNNYYTLKYDYEEIINEKKLEIIKKKGIGWKEKRVEFRKYKPKCINCRRRVGSIFSTNLDKDFNKSLSALCGDKVNPCNLNIQLNIHDVELIPEIIQEYNEEINSLKNKIIINKNNLLFGYESAEKSIEEFDILREELENFLKIFENTNELYYDITENPKKKNIYREKQKKFYEFLENYKLFISTYDKNREIEFIKEAVELYIKNILPLANDIRNLKYEYVGVEKQENEYFLIEKQIKIENLESIYTFENENENTKSPSLRNETSTLSNVDSQNDSNNSTIESVA